jgi:drug/metabolite transporter (DMT)-like permease
MADRVVFMASVAWAVASVSRVAVVAAARTAVLADDEEAAADDNGGLAAALAPEGRADSEWAAGILLCLAGAAATNLGLTLQKRSFLNNDACSPSKQRAAGKQPLWLGGLFVFLIGQLLNLLAFGYTSQALAATLGSFSLVTNGVFAPCLLRERLTKPIVLSIGVIMAGSVAVVLSSSRAPQEYALDELVHLLQRPLFVAYLSVLVLAFVASQVLMLREHSAHKRASDDADEWDAAEAGRVAQKPFSNGDDTLPSPSPSPKTMTTKIRVLPASPSRWDIEQQQTQQLPQQQQHQSVAAAEKPTERTSLLGGGGGRGRRSPQPASSPQSSPSSASSTSSSNGGGPGRPAPLSSVTPIVAGAILSSCSVLFGKCSVQLLKASMAGENQFKHPLSWLLTTVFVVCAVSAVGYLNIGLRRGTALFVVPLYYVLNTLLAIVGGLVYFEEFRRFQPAQGALFAAGVATTILGVYMSSRKQVQVEDGGEDEDSEQGEEDESLIDTEAELEEQASPMDAATSAAATESFVSAVSSPETAGPEPKGAAAAEPISPTPEIVTISSIAPSSSASRPPSALKPSRRTLSPSSGPSRATTAGGAGAPGGEAEEHDESRAAARARRSLSVRFGDESIGGPEANGSVRLIRALSEPGIETTTTDEEVAASSSSLSPPSEAAEAALLRSHPALSTPQPSWRYGSMGSALAASARAFRTPGPDHASMRRLDYPPASEGDAKAAASSSSGVRRARSMSALTSNAQSAAPLRDQQLKAASWRRGSQHHLKRYSLDHSAFQSSFLRPQASSAAAAATAPNVKVKPPPFERRYSVAVLGLGIS